jgi:hypothetical protein
MVLDTSSVTADLRVAVWERRRNGHGNDDRGAGGLLVIGRGTVSESFGRLRTHAFGIIQRSPCPIVSG